MAKMKCESNINNETKMKANEMKKIEIEENVMKWRNENVEENMAKENERNDNEMKMKVSIVKKWNSNSKLKMKMKM